MARRRIRSKPFTGDLSFNQPKVLESLSELSSFSEPEDEIDLKGTSQYIEPVDGYKFPELVRNSEVFEDKVGVDDVPGIPEGIELLGDLAGLESEEDALDVVGESEPPVRSFGGLPDPLEVIRMRVAEEPELINDLPEETRRLLEVSQTEPEKIVSPLEEDMISEEITETPQEMQQEAVQENISPIPEAVEALPEEGTFREVNEFDISEEGLGPMEGATDFAQNDEAVQNNIKNLLNLKEGSVPKEVWEHIKMSEKILTQEEQNLTEMEKEYKAKLDRGDLSTFDKVAIGIAIALPFIIGSIYGKGALFSPLGGTLTGFTEQMKKQDEVDVKNLKNLQEVQKMKGSISEKRAKLREDYLKHIENPGLKKFLSNYDIIDITETPDGQQQVTLGNDAKLFGNKIGISGGDREGLLWYDTNQIRDDEDLKEFKKNISEGKQVVEKLPEVESNIDRITAIMDAIRDQNPGYWRTLKSQKLGAIPVGEYNSIMVDLVDKNGNIEKVMALPLLKQEIGTLMDTYRTGFLKGTRFSEHFQKHFKDIFSDVSDANEFLSQNMDTMRVRADRFRNTMTNRIISDLGSIGFITKPLEDRFKKEQAVPRQKGIIRAQAREEILSNPEQAKSLMR